MINENILIAFITAFPPTLAALLALKAGKENAKAIQNVHISIDGRMDELLKSTNRDSLQKGKEIGRAEVK